MEFRTIIEPHKSELNITHRSGLMLFGSCFAENIGHLLADNKFNVNVNPFGILYNPLSVSKVLHRICKCELFEKEDLVVRDGIYHSFLHHGNYSGLDEDVVLANINNSLRQAHEDLCKADTLIVTFGTSYVFTIKDKGDVVANCHKFPSSFFNRFRLSVSEIVNDWIALINRLRDLNPKLNVLFTVSPIRHWKDGAHDNQLSKSILLLAIDEIRRKIEDVYYFLSYELLLDDLRDYRFYAEDMIHPNKVAVEYIWDVFKKTFFDNETELLIKEWVGISQAANHRPFNVASESHKAFLRQTLLRLDSFKKKYPYIELEKEKSVLEDQLK